MRVYLKILIGLLFFPLGVSAQYFESGQDPSKVKWSQIQTENFQIIFPVDFEREAQRLANAMELVYIYDTQTLKHQPKKVSIILHNFSSLGNAFVAWAPKRAEFYTMPPQNIYPQDWLDQLALHEYRHVVQIDKMNQGLTKILHFILGEQATAGILGLFVPSWFLEGDAVAVETGLSKSGRGRLPRFEMEIRTQVLGRKIYSYEKAVFRSYKDFVPDHYQLGYYLVANARKRYGTEIWDKTINHVARNPYTPTPFSRGIKKGSGLNKWKYYRSAMTELDSLWRKQQTETTYTSFKKINERAKKAYTNYRFPQTICDSLIVVQKYGMADIAKFVLLKPDGTEKKIFTPGYFDPVKLSASKNLIAWGEYGFDKRWQNRLYNDILTYDLKTHKRKRLTKKKYLFAPVLSPDALKIAAVEITPDNSYSLILLEASTGKELKRFTHSENALWLTPSWSEDGKYIVSVIMTNQGKAIAMMDINEGVLTIVLPFSFKDISQPVHSGRYIFYHGTYSGIDNIYAIDILSKEIFQVTSSRYGAFDPAISSDGDKLLYSDYSPLGFNIAETPLRPEEWIPLPAVQDNSIKLYEVLAIQEGGAVNFDSLPQTLYPIKRYRKFTHLLNIHSWSPVYANANNTTTLDPQITLLSQNKLSTAIVTAGYLYNYNERTGSFTTNISYKAWYPVINFASSNGRRASYILNNGEKQYYSWQEDRVSLGVSQPLNLTRGKYSRAITPSVSIGFMHITNPADVPDNFFTGKILNTQYDIQAQRLLKTAVRDMRPRWGQTVLLNYKEAPYGDVKIKSMLSVESAFFFPGVFKHHSLKITLADQIQGTGNYNFISPVSYIRGYYRAFNHDEFRKVSLDYMLPLLYPDLRIGPLVYLQRVKGNFFYDYGMGLNKTGNVSYHSVGAEITSDMHLLNFIAPFDIGFRYIFLPEISRSNIELLFNINFNDI